MKIYLLILALSVLSLSKFRHLSNLTIKTPTPPLIKCLTPTEIAYQSQTTVNTLNLINQTILQTITLPPQSSIELLASQTSLLYINQNTIYQAHSNAKKYELKMTLPQDNWALPMSSFGETLILPVYGDVDEPKTFNIFGPNPWNSRKITWNGLKGENIKGGSGVNFINENQFYFAAGGVCNNDENDKIYLQKSNGIQISNVYSFPIKNCDFGFVNRKWTLQTNLFIAPFSNMIYHLLTYVSSQQTPKKYTSQLVSNVDGNFIDVAHFDIDRLIGVGVASENVIYTADTLLCRVLEHDIQNHEHNHLPSAFYEKPIYSFVTASDKTIVTVAKSDNTKQYRQSVVQTINQNFEFTGMHNFMISPTTNVVKSQILLEEYIFLIDDSQERKLSLWNLKNDVGYDTKITGVVDFCVSDTVIFIIYANANLEHVLGVYTLTEDVFTLLKQNPLSDIYKSVTCLDKNNALLNPSTANDLLLIWNYDQVTPRSSLPKTPKIHASFAYSNDILIFTGSDSASTVFYDYDFNVVTQSFNLPPDSVYKIVQARKGQLILAVGNDITSFASLEHYVNTDSVITYSGTFPYLDDGTADLEKTIIFPERGAIHIEYESGTTEWSTYFLLSSPPLKSYGYFADETDKTCSFYQDAVFRTTTATPEMIVLNANNNYPILEKYAIADNKLTKTQSYPLNQYKVTQIHLELTSNHNQIIISGIDLSRNYNIQVRNFNLLSTKVFSKVQARSVDDEKLEDVNIVDGLIVTAYSAYEDVDDSETLEIVFEPNSENPIALDTNIFNKITLFAVCPNCNKIAYTGDLKVVAATSTIIVADYVNPSEFDSITVDCTPNFLAVAPGGTSIAWSCTKNELFFYELKTKLLMPLTAVYTSITELSFLDKTHLLATLDGKLTSISVPIFIQPSSKIQNVNLGLTNTYAIDYNKGIYALAINASTIQIYNFNNKLIDTYTLNNNQDISSLSFNSNGELYISNSQGTVIALTEAACPKNSSLVQGFCQCNTLFVQNGDQCTCNYVYEESQGLCQCNTLFVQNGDQCTCNYVYEESGQCVCDDGYYFDGGSNCNECSAMCSTCKSDGAFDCEDYSVWFFLIIIGSILLVGAAVLVIIFKMKKNKGKVDTMYTEQKSKITEPFVSQKEEQSEEVMRRSLEK